MNMAKKETEKIQQKGKSERYNACGGLDPPPLLDFRMEEVKSQGIWLVSRS